MDDLTASKIFRNSNIREYSQKSKKLIKQLIYINLWENHWLLSNHRQKRKQ